MRYYFLAQFTLIVLILGFSANAGEKSSDSLTIYNNVNIDPGVQYQTRSYPPVIREQMQQVTGYAIVRQEREINIPEKRSTVNFSDVTALIDPTTVSFKSLTDPKGTQVLEQNFLYDLANSNKLLERYLGQNISVEYKSGETTKNISGKLISHSNGLIIEESGGKTVSINQYSRIDFPSLPGGLMIKPTLAWNIATEKTGKHRIETSYETKGMTWWADYNLTYIEGKNANNGFIDVGAWVTIVNQSGGSFNDARIKLMAGEVNRASDMTVTNGIAMQEMVAVPRAASAQRFEEKSFFEYHLYTLNRNVNLPNNSTKQIELFPAVLKVPVEKQYIFQNNDKNANIYLSFKNSKEQNLGIPLPAGRIRVSKKDDDSSLEFIGEDSIDHTPKDEEVLVKLGGAFDIVGERKHLDSKSDHSARWSENTYEITLKNHKEESVKVIIKENVNGNWKIKDASHSYEKINANTIHFPIKITKNGKETLKYTVRQTW